jgi:hypothetical protein
MWLRLQVSNFNCPNLWAYECLVIHSGSLHNRVCTTTIDSESDPADDWPSDHE